MPLALDVVDAGFYRDRSAFLVGRWVFAGDRLMPFVVAFLNGEDGIRADAVLHQVSDIHDLFSSTLANFHVTTRLYYQTCVFLYSLMPLRPLGHHYSTIGFNHVGKVAILNEIVEQMRASGQRFQRSPGAPGTVALGFTFDACSYHLKVVRDAPTVSYKWGSFPGVAAVIDKYRVVHEINRAGSMLDNVMYFNLRLDRELFDLGLLEEICQQAPGSVHLAETGVFLRSLIVQLKIVPLPVYLETSGENETRAVIVSLGHCIRNNAATNIFNKDLDCRNYGVGRYGRVFLFDYDAVEKLTDVKIRTNTDLEPGEEGVPAWFFEDGVVFLPEELEHGMQFKNDYARRCFRQVNRDLMTLEYWTRVQEMLKADELPELRVYPEIRQVAGRRQGGGLRSDEPTGRAVWIVESRHPVGSAEGIARSFDHLSPRKRHHERSRGARIAGADGTVLERTRGFQSGTPGPPRIAHPSHRGFRGARRLAGRGSGHQFSRDDGQLADPAYPSEPAVPDRRRCRGASSSRRGGQCRVRCRRTRLGAETARRGTSAGQVVCAKGHGPQAGSRERRRAELGAAAGRRAHTDGGCAHGSVAGSGLPRPVSRDVGAVQHPG